ncbi:MAG TPA: protease modulator HflC [Acidisphaera sp.]|nr:protease modulator HflC [Acidisphaera sp.]
MKMRTWSIVGAVVIVIALLVLNSSLFIVEQTEQALITQFGKPVRVVNTPGLHVKLPLIQTVIDFDNRLLMYVQPNEEVILGDQRRLIVDSFTMLRITDTLKLYQSVGITEDAIRNRLSSVVQSAMRRVLGNNALLAVLSADRARIMAAIRDQVNAEMKGFGVLVEDVRIRRADLPLENTQAILDRMTSERVRVAKQARAEGAEAAAKIRADADRDRTVLLAEARATADQLRGAGEAAASRIYAEAYSQDPNFFGFWRTMQAYEAAFASGNDKLVLTPGNDFLRLLQTAPSPGP